jgi:hypothetical protein
MVITDSPSTDFETYRQVIGDLLAPIGQNGLDWETLKKLYESKLVYLQNLRVRCFYEINRSPAPQFSTADYELILQALRETRLHLKHLILHAVNDSLEKSK